MIQLCSDLRLKLCVGIFLLSSLFLTTSYNTTFAFDRPISTSVFVCFLTGFTLLVWSRFVSLTSSPSLPISKRPVIALAEQFELPSRASTSSFSLGDVETRPRLRFQLWWIKIGLLMGLCGLRIESFRQVTLNTECAPAGYAYAIPFVISLYDYWRNQRSRQVDKYVPTQRFEKLPLQVVYSASRRSFYYLTQSRSRGLIAAAFLSVGGLLASSFSAGTRSTYICPIMLHGASRLRSYRLFNLFADSVILIGITELCRIGTQFDDARRKRALTFLGAGLLGLSLVWSVIPYLVPGSFPEFASQPVLGLEYSRSAFSQSVLVLILVLSAWHMLPHFDILGVSIIAGFMIVYFSSSSILTEQQTFPYISLTHVVLSLAASLTGALLFLLARVVHGEEPKLYRTNVAIQILFAVLCGISLVFAVSKHRLADIHPIEILINNGEIKHHNYLAQASRSKTLGDAVTEYRRRYNQHPPPGFDEWYQYATSRSSAIIDDFDQIYHDLLPFRALAPEHIRAMTHELATNPFNDLGGIRIRNGTAMVQEGIKPTHAWMVAGAADMMKNFSKYLPDMDLVFNLNDEPRVTVPWEKISMLNRQTEMQEMVPNERMVHTWSNNREEGWGPIEPADQTNITVFTDGAWRGVFDPYVSAVCPPSSKARSQRIWNRHEICLSCVAPHSMGQFPLDFNIASEICHQPDLAFLHGLLISPASFKVSQELIPVFSQSALTGFNDILFPSPWNYIDKIKYQPTDEHPDPEYSQKENSLYWLGSTSEGVSRFGEWKGMPRQRFAHLINNNTNNQVSVLLPTDSNEKSFRYETMDGSAPTSDLGLQTAVHIADPIVRCDFGDCDEQAEELGIAGWADFQAHWSHRFLFDLDGAGFSGRFLPFLHSRSLPLKTGLFRQWFDSRVTSWLHFVPVDIRLHGLWSTLAYFAGVPATASEERGPNSQMRMKAHDEQGKWIAEEGRKWASTALRKDDMEIYFFRLLLEWGRLTDDQRDVLGFGV
ncbi:Lipopolysaccharide-modifying protein [Penicillium expansum]|uniref:Lipopolysaccharide-modifying protein n=1 Tax=Penicillium expansum TaxID=27334 RepID=A0A0A2JK00_PENEN|nr:Lipopolysaccharide-modifying protein [Penicillium expansum]KGO55023.1 Lipopolysaccharide-modifying protein [Penicillium expansum]KGO62712.1 Lipopolysaccharide-modifying protein [Penicillium expansum]